MSKFVVDDSYSGYVYVGNAQGQFMPDDSQDMRPYYNMFVVSPVSSWSSADYQASGFKAEKKKCLSADVWKDLNPGDRIKLFFDDKKRVVMVALDK